MTRTLSAGFFGLIFFVIMTAVLEKNRYVGGDLWNGDDIPSSTIWTWVILGVYLILIFVQATRPVEDEWVGPNREGTLPFFDRFFSDPQFGGIVWFAVRVELGRQWLEAGLHKVREGAWMDTGFALRGFLERAVTVPPEGQGRPPITYDRYRDLLEYVIRHEWYEWLAPVVAVGEVLVGLGLIFGALTGIAAFFGMFMNANFLLAGTTSTNPVMLLIAVPLMLAWRVSGWIGLDRILLPILGVPWNRFNSTRFGRHG